MLYPVSILDVCEFGVYFNLWLFQMFEYSSGCSTDYRAYVILGTLVVQLVMGLTNVLEIV